MPAAEKSSQVADRTGRSGSVPGYYSDPDYSSDSVLCPDLYYPAYFADSDHFADHSADLCCPDCSGSGSDPGFGSGHSARHRHHFSADLPVSSSRRYSSLYLTCL